MDDLGAVLHGHIEALFPLLRSITGPGLRRTLQYVADRIPLQIREVPSGTRVLDWEVPPEWTVRGAGLRRMNGETVVDIGGNNLHLLQYSRPVDRVVALDELQRHLHSLPEQPDLIPYRTAYYADTWGFCLPHRVREALTDPEYRVRIDSTVAPGGLSYGECFLPGEAGRNESFARGHCGSDAHDGEVLVSVHCCHPSLANDNLSGLAVAVELARALAARPRRRLGYRFLFVPGTIGAITWLHFNRDAPRRVRHGLVLSCVGDAGPPTYKRSRRGNAPIDRYAAHVLRAAGHGEDRLLPFVPYGYDERQYCSPGFDLPVGCFMRSPNGTFPEYHTSADDLAFVRPEALADSFALLGRVVELIERDVVWRSTQPYGEPQLGRRGLYRPVGGTSGEGAGRGEASASPEAAGYDQMALLWVLNLADGRHSLLDMAERSGKRFEELAAAADALAGVGLLERADLERADPADRGA